MDPKTNSFYFHFRWMLQVCSSNCEDFIGFTVSNELPINSNKIHLYAGLIDRHKLSQLLHNNILQCSTGARTIPHIASTLRHLYTKVSQNSRPTMFEFNTVLAHVLEIPKICCTVYLSATNRWKFSSSKFDRHNRTENFRFYVKEFCHSILCMCANDFYCYPFFSMSICVESSHFHISHRETKKENLHVDEREAN